MRIKGFLDEDFINYKEPSMYICSAFCSLKCELLYGAGCCQNSSLASLKELSNVPDELIIERYISNPITKAIVISGLEPFEQFTEVSNLIAKLRNVYHCNDPVVIYTGFDKDEILTMINWLRPFKNIIVKFGRFMPNQSPHFDEVLGVKLASDNQYAERIS